MRTERLKIGNVRGPKGDGTKITEVAVTVTENGVDEVPKPSATVEMTGTDEDKHLSITFDGIKGRHGTDAKIVDASATSDNTHLENPTVDVTVGGVPGNQTLEFDFKGLQGAPGIASIPDPLPVENGGTGAKSLDDFINSLGIEATNQTDIDSLFDE